VLVAVIPLTVATTVSGQQINCPQNVLERETERERERESLNEDRKPKSELPITV
jgi:hypothetical protein